MLLDRFGYSNKFWKKKWKKFWDIQVWVLWRSSRGRPESNSHGRPLNARLERPLDFISGRQIRTSPRCQIWASPCWSNRIFRGRPEDTGEGRTRDVLGTNICRLGSYTNFLFINNWLEIRNQKYSLGFAKYLETGVSQVYQICHKYL